MTVIRIKICRQTGPYGRVPQNRFWFVPNCEQGCTKHFIGRESQNRSSLFERWLKGEKPETHNSSNLDKSH